MARGLAHRPPPCAEHPHRPAVDHCDECGKRFCAECLVRGGPQLLCRNCWRQGPIRAAETLRRKRFSYRISSALRDPERRASLIASVIIVVVLAVIGVTSGVGILSESSRTQMAEPVARAVVARQVLAGEGDMPRALPSTPPGPTRIPTLIIDPAPVAGAPGMNLFALVDGRAGEGAPTWRSAPGRTAVDIRFITNTPVLAGRVLFGQSADAPPETWVQHVEVWTSPSLEDGDLTYAGRWKLQQTIEPQTFSFGRRQVRSVLLRILSNYGSADYTSLAEFALLPAG